MRGDRKFGAPIRDQCVFRAAYHIMCLSADKLPECCCGEAPAARSPVNREMGASEKFLVKISEA